MKRVYLEITDSCNLNCPFCTYEKSNHFLSLAEIDDYTDQIRDYTDYIYLHILGEPLLHPDFNEILDLLDRKGFRLQLVTNGTLLDRHPDLTSHSCLRKLSISLHSVNHLNISQSYFETIDSLIESDHNTIIDLRFYDPSRLDQPLNTYLNSLKERYGLEATSRKDSYRLKENTYVSFAELFDWPQIHDPVISDTGACHGGIDMIAINSQSEVTLCCLDPKGYNSLGNLKKRSLKEILDSKEYIQTVTDLRNGKLSRDLCRRCSYRLRFR